MSRATDRPVTLGLRERQRLMQAIWFGILWASFLGVAVPWYLRLLPIDLGPFTSILFVFGSLLFVASPAIETLRSRAGLVRALTALHLVGLGVLAVAWQMVGGLENPVFLLVFPLAVIAGGALSVRWLPYLTALVALLLVVIMALAEQPELRWTAARFGLPLGAPDLGRPAFAQSPFPALSPPPGGALALLHGFGLLLGTAAFFVDSLSGQLARLYQRLETSGAAAERAEGLTREVVRASPEPVVLLSDPGLRVVEASDSFFSQLLLDEADLAERGFLELIDFSYPDIVEATLFGERQDAPIIVYRLGAETRFARLESYRIRQGDQRYLYATLRDVSELYFLEAALDALDEALLVVSIEDRLVYFNRTASELLGPLAFGQPAGDALAACSLEPGWWRPGLRRRQQRPVRPQDAPYLATVLAVDVPGEEGKLAVIRLTPAEEAA